MKALCGLGLVCIFVSHLIHCSMLHEELRETYRLITSKQLAGRLCEFYYQIMELAASEYSDIGFRVNLDGRWNRLLLKRERSNSVYEKAYAAFFEPEYKEDDPVDTLVSDIILKRSNPTWFLVAGVQFSTRSERRISYQYTWMRDRTATATMKMHTYHSMSVGKFDQNKIEAYFDAQPLSLNQLKEVIKTLEKSSRDRRLKTYVRTWKRLERIISLSFTFGKKTNPHRKVGIKITPYRNHESVLESL